MGDLLLSWSPSGPFIDRVLEHIPPGKVRDGIAEARRMLTVTDPETVAYFLGNGRDVAARDTVPFTIWAAARNLTDFEQAIWSTATVGGDVDTTCAIVGGITAAAAESGASQRRGCELPSRSPSGSIPLKDRLHCGRCSPACGRPMAETDLRAGSVQNFLKTRGRDGWASGMSDLLANLFV